MNCETGQRLRVPTLPDIIPARQEAETVTSHPEDLKGKEAPIGVYVVLGVVTVAGLATVYICVRTRRAGLRLGDGAQNGRVTVTVGVDGQPTNQAGPMASLATSTVLPRYVST